MSGPSEDGALNGGHARKAGETRLPDAHEAPTFDDGAARPPAERVPKGKVGRKTRGRSRARVPARFLVPNIITLLALCAGLTSIRLALEGRFEIAVVAILLASFLDGIDGRVARLLRSTSRFGAELDSLTDFVNFGVAPALILYVWVLNDVGGLGWLSVLVFTICCALRLARFNAALDDVDRPKWMASYFVGVPAPAGACLLLLPAYLHFAGLPSVMEAAPLLMAYCVVVAFLMASRLPTFSGKLISRQIGRSIVMPLFFIVVVVLGLLASFTWATIAALAGVYLGLMPVSYLRYHARLKRGEGAAPPADSPKA